MQSNYEGNIYRGLHGSCIPQPAGRVRYFFQFHGLERVLRTMEVAVCRSSVYRVLFANDGAP